MAMSDMLVTSIHDCSRAAEVCGFVAGGVSPETLNGSESIRPSVTDEKNKSPYVASRALREAV